MMVVVVDGVMMETMVMIKVKMMKDDGGDHEENDEDETVISKRNCQLDPRHRAKLFTHLVFLISFLFH